VPACEPRKRRKLELDECLFEIVRHHMLTAPPLPTEAERPGPQAALRYGSPPAPARHSRSSRGRTPVPARADHLRRDIHAIERQSL
jgi:hypothetical protein